MAAKKKENPIQKAVETILEKKGVDFNEWKKGVINKKKLAVMSDEDKEWTEQTIHNASLDLIMENVISNSDSSSNTKDLHE